MKLSEKAIQEFRQIYKQEFDKEITPSEADRLGTNLISLIKLVYKPIPINQSEGSTARSGKLARGERRPTEATDIPIINR